MQRISLAGTWLGSSRRGYLVLAALAAIGACSNDNSVTPLTATSITANATTNGQTGAAGTALAQPVGLLVVDQNGAPLANATVNWAVEAGGGSVASTTSVTDATGNATVVWTLGTTVGTDSLMASIAGGADAFITATAAAGPASAERITSVTWAVTGGGTLSATTSTTDATGSTQVTLTTDAVPANYSVTATTGSIAPVAFAITAM